VSAAVRLSPVPQAFRLIRKSGTSPAWKRRTGRSQQRSLFSLSFEKAVERMCDYQPVYLDPRLRYAA
jgi:hypothetical protein